MDQLFVHQHVPPTPRGLEASCQLEDFPFYSDYRPCVVDGNDQYHYPSTVGGTCRRGFAVFSEVRCQVRLLTTYPCCYDSDSPPIPIVVIPDMNIFVYCTDNFAGGILTLSLAGGQSMQIMTPDPSTGGAYFYHGGNFGVNNYSFDVLGTNPPTVAVITRDSTYPPVPLLSSLSRLSVGEQRLADHDCMEIPGGLRGCHLRYIMNMYRRV